MTDDERAIIHSYGGGVQSAAIAVLVVQGKLPRPARIVMADTGREATLTWSYLRNCVQPLLAEIGLEVEVASHDLALVDLHAKSGDGRPLFPVFTDTGGRLPNLCSVEWKRRVVGRWLRAQGYGPKRPVVQWLGISKDEVHRAKPSDLLWASLDFPLLDLNLSRADCVRLVEKAGLPTPPRSSCWMCPFRSDVEWTALKNRGDGDWQKAVKMDEHIRGDGTGGAPDPDCKRCEGTGRLDECDPRGPAGNFTHERCSCVVGGLLYLHRSAKPLADVEFRHEKQGDLFDVCEEGRCEF